jgi:hypothetical protein
MPNDALQLQYGSKVNPPCSTRAYPSALRREEPAARARLNAIEMFLGYAATTSAIGCLYSRRRGRTSSANSVRLLTVSSWVR